MNIQLPEIPVPSFSVPSIVPWVLIILVTATLVKSFSDAVFRTIFGFKIVRVLLFLVLVYLVLLVLKVPLPSITLLIERLRK